MVVAQTSEIIRSSRPGQSFTPYTVGSGVFQIQSGLNINGFEASAEEDGNGLFLAALGRYGISETIEVRSEFQFANNKVTFRDQEETFNGLSAWTSWYEV